MAADELRRRLDDEVGTQLDRPAQVRRGERVVDDQQCAMGVGNPGQRRDVGNHDRRVRDRLDVEDAGRHRCELGFDRGEVGRVDERRADAQPPELVGEERAGRAVDRRRGQDPVAGPQDRGERGVDRSHPAGEDAGRLGALDRGDCLGQGRAGRVVEPGVGVTRARARRDRAEFLGISGRERRRQVERHGVRPLVDDRRRRGGLDGSRGKAAARAIRGVRRALAHDRMLHRPGTRTP